MSFQSARAPCVKCGNLLHTGEGRVLMSFTADELDELHHLLMVTSNENYIPREVSGQLQARIWCARSLL